MNVLVSWAGRAVRAADVNPCLVWPSAQVGPGTVELARADEQGRYD